MANWLQRTAARLLLGEAKDITDSLQLFREVYGGRLNEAGEAISWRTALQVTTVLACNRVLAEGVAQVPFQVYQETEKGKAVARDHPLNALLDIEPYPGHSSFEFRETLMFHLGLLFNGYSFVNRVGRSRRIAEIVPLDASRMHVRALDDTTLSYRYTTISGETREFPPDAIWHLRGPSWNSLWGLDAVALAARAVGLASAIERGQMSFQAHGARNSGVLAVEGTLDDAGFKRLSAWLDRHELAGDRADKPIIVDRAAEWTSTGSSGVDAQLLETRKFQVAEICRGYRVMPIMVGESDKAATYASAEQMFLAHVTHTLMPWYRRWEQSAAINLLSPEDRAAGYYVKFNANALMRGTAVDRASYYAKALGAGNAKGWMTQNEVRGYEDDPRSDDPKADELPQPTVKVAMPAPTDEGNPTP